MTDSFNFDFLSELSKVAGNSGYFKSVPPTSDTDRDPMDVNDDDSFESPYKELYDNLKEDFKSYKNRVNNLIEIEKRNIRNEMMKDFLNMVEYITLVMDGKRRNGTLMEEDRMVMDKMMNMLESRFNIVPMKDLEGKMFDHRFHDAVMMNCNDSDMPSGTITRVYSNGYIEKDSGEVLIHAKVEVMG